MNIIPILDLKGGSCIYTCAQESEEQIIIENPLEVVAKWIDDKIERIHIIDIDALKSREPENVSTVRALKKAFPNLILEISGAVLNDEHILIWLDAGVDFLSLSAKSVAQKDLLEAYSMEYPGKIMISIDLVEGKQMNPRLIPRYGTEINEVIDNLQNDGIQGLILSNHLSNGVQSGCFQYTQDIITQQNMPIFINHNKQNCLNDEQLDSLNTKAIQGLIISREIYNNIPLINKIRNL